MTIERAKTEIINAVKNAIELADRFTIAELNNYWEVEITKDGMLCLNINGHVWETLFGITIAKWDIREIRELAWLYYRTIQLFYSICISK